MTGRIPAQTFPVGCYILEELAARGGTMRTLCDIAGYSIPDADAIIDGRQTITPEIALTLALTFGISGEVWLNLQESHAAWLQARRQP